MGSHIVVLFSLLLISSIVLISSVQNSFADDVIATSTGFENSTILELKNSRGNSANIDSVRIWLSGENEFKSFKTEQGWLGKKQLNGVIEFTSQKEVNPGDSVKFGIKTIQKNPVINWKAIDGNGNTIFSAATKITKSESDEYEPELNKPKIITVKDESIFRFIPEKPSSNANFRVIGENFVPNQSLDFYIGNTLEKSIQVDGDGKIFFTAKAPDVKNDERTEFILRDSGGNEKTLSIRIPVLEIREIPEIIKLSLGNTPMNVKRGDTIALDGMATPNTTLTITSKHENGSIISVDTIQVGFDGKWNYDNLFSPELEIGRVSIEISDGQSSVLRNMNVKSAKIINISSEKTMYEPGETVFFEGNALPNQQMSIILEDSIGTEVFAKNILVGETGNISFEIEISRGAVEGTYTLLAFQGNEQGLSVVGIGQEPQELINVRAAKLNFGSGEIAEFLIQGPSNGQLALILIDASDREKLSESINLGPDGVENYKIDTGDLSTGAYTLNIQRGESSSSSVFTIGLTSGSGPITIQTTKEDYRPGDPILILGSTATTNVLLDITIVDSSGTTIKIVNTFSDKFGVFKIDNFRIPSDGKTGVWTISAKSGGNFNDTKFTVMGEGDSIVLSSDKSSYGEKDLINFTGTGARMSATVSIMIYDSEEGVVDELNITAKSNGEYSTIWKVPDNLAAGEYSVVANDGAATASIKIIIE